MWYCTTLSDWQRWKHLIVHCVGQHVRMWALSYFASEDVTCDDLLREHLVLCIMTLDYMLFDPATLLVGIYLTDIFTNTCDGELRNMDYSIVKTEAWKQLQPLSYL